jgi:hypothetical protein
MPSMHSSLLPLGLVSLKSASGNFQIPESQKPLYSTVREIERTARSSKKISKSLRDKARNKKREGEAPAEPCCGSFWSFRLGGSLALPEIAKERRKTRFHHCEQ